MAEKYRSCTDAISVMMQDLSDLERRLAEQEPVSEHPEGLRNQINLVKVPAGYYLLFSFEMFSVHLNFWV